MRVKVSKTQVNSIDVERYGKLLVCLSNEYGRYLAYSFKGWIVEIDKVNGEIESMSVSTSEPKYLETLIASKDNEVFTLSK